MAEAAPDAATERVTKNSVRHAKRLTTELQNKRESLNDQRREFRKLLSKRDRTIDGLRAERDAALAVLERIRQAVSGHPECDRYEEGDVISCGWKSAYASVVAALDGAPEPEWEYGMQDDYGLSFMRNIAEAYDHANRQDPELNPRPVRRRKAGPWLPVEGES